MKIKDIMSTEVIFVSPETNISKVADIIFSNRFHGVPVLEKNKLVGIVTEDDFFLKDNDGLFLPTYIRFLKDNHPKGGLPGDIKKKIRTLLGMKTKNIMTANCQTVSPEMESEDLMDLIKKTKFTTFPVTDENNTLLGIVTLADILGTVRKASGEMKEAFVRQSNKEEISQLATEINDIWKDKIVSISRHSVRTWKGGILIASVAIVLTGAMWAVLFLNKPDCGLEDKDVLLIQCQRFAYSDWSQCDKNQMQTRKVIRSFPENCEGGAPILSRPCQ